MKEDTGMMRIVITCLSMILSGCILWENNSTGFSETPKTKQVQLYSDTDFVLVQEIVKDIQIDLKYASEENFTGQTIYDFTDAYLRYGTVLKLKKAQELVEQEGYSLKIWDAFRPVSAQYKLWEIYPDSTYVANPEKGFSSHSRGNTVDITLVLADGSGIEMPTEFDDFSLKADRDYSDCSEEAAKNARYLENIMKQCGFKGYSGEWWHFTDEDSYQVEKNFKPCFFDRG